MNSSIITTKSILASRTATAWLLALVFGPWCAIPVLGQTYFSATANPTSPDPPVMFTINTPSGVVSGDQFVVVKLIVKSTGGAVPIFRVEPTSVLKYGFAELGVNDSQAILQVGSSIQVAQIAVLEITSSSPATDLFVQPATDYRLVKLILQYQSGYNFTSSDLWKIRLKQPTAGAVEVSGFSMEGTVQNTLIAACTRPKIIAPTSINFEEVHKGISAGLAPNRPVEVQNLGTDNLAITSLSLSGPNASSFTREALLAPLKPGEKLNNTWDAVGNAVASGLFVVAKPASTGPQAATLTLSSATESAAVGLTATGFLFYGHLLIDVSDSMGTTMGSANLTRLDVAVDSAQELNNWVNDFSDGEAWLGLSTFPGLTSGDSSVPVKIDKEDNNHGAINAQMSVFNPRDCTPMQAGIEAAFNDMQSGNPGTTVLKKTILLLTDGWQCVPSDALSKKSTLDSAGIRVFSVGVANPGGVDETLLKGLAFAPDWFAKANADDPNAVKKAFIKAAQRWLSLQNVQDPQNDIQPGQTRTHQVCIEDYADGITFSVDWNRKAPGGIEFTLDSPTGETITPNSAGVFFHSGNTFAQYVILGGRVRGGLGRGVWTLRLVGGTSLPSGQDSKYTYNVMVQSNIRIESNAGTIPLGTGISSALNLSFTGLGAEDLGNLLVAAEMDAPTDSFRTWLATNTVNPEWVLSSNLFDQDHASVVQRKVNALSTFKSLRFDDRRKVTALTPVYLPADGTFIMTPPQATREGIYEYSFRVSGTLTGGGCLSRTLSVTRFIEPTLTPALLADAVAVLDFQRTAFFDERIFNAIGTNVPSGWRNIVVKFTPRDANGNLFGMGYVDRIGIDVRNGEPLGPLVDNWDGSYLRVLQYPTNNLASFVLRVNDVSTGAIPIENPHLQISEAGTNLIITWTGAAWIPEESLNLTLTNGWKNLDAVVDVENGVFKVSLPIPASSPGSRFFRLRR